MILKKNFEEDSTGNKMVRVLLDWRRSLRFKRELNTRFSNKEAFLDSGYVIIVIKSFVILSG